MCCNNLNTNYSFHTKFLYKVIVKNALLTPFNTVNTGILELKYHSIPSS